MTCREFGCRPSPITGRCVLCNINPICGSTVACAHDGGTVGHGPVSDREGPEQAPTADIAARLADTERETDALLTEPRARRPRARTLQRASRSPSPVRRDLERRSVPRQVPIGRVVTEKQRAFLAHVGKLYSACVGDPHANSRTITEADAALQHIVRDARNAGLSPRDIADAMRIPLAAVLA